MKAKVKILIAMIAVLVVTTLSTIFASNASDVVQVRAWGARVITPGTNTWYNLEFRQEGSSGFAYSGTTSGDSLTNVNYMSYFFETSFQSIGSFDITIKETNPDLANLGNWGAYSIEIYKYNSSGGLNQVASLTSETTYTPVQNGDGSWSISWSYLGDSIAGNIIRVSYRCSPYNLVASTWKAVYIDNFVVNGTTAEEIEVEQDVEGIAEALSLYSSSEDALWGRIVAPNLGEVMIDQNTSDAMQNTGYFALLTGVSTFNFIVPSLILIVVTTAFYSYIIFGKKG